MSDELYLAIMLGVVAILTVIAVPALIRRKCPKCGARNGIDAKVCKQCNTSLTDT